ncbi:flagellar basal-body rod protein FlgF [Sediminicurvatus halobius]|uniref:Flagellar basal-body rod protein FlgF n=1 Tax=Sediminicurvatus halobius TaxID=2182432 RepID=A0A2U2MZL5_9GAMM|nr:flagellar basal-body rod protein FlgF [Spiribacter halobius]PWG62310.1 flagellar basal-body rod protein FlgF [Spiribacter halobius]UEX79769.1 flagellar basal-body rod protein FlgF [Spiribacter halobius]
MDRMVYLAMTGAKHAFEAQRVNNHNLANVNTPGFRADLESLQSRPMSGPGHPARVYSEAVGMGADLSQGPLVSTGRELDVAIKGEGWIAVQAADGTEGYTRRGDLQISTGGLLETGDGRLVLGEAGPVAVPPAEKIEIGEDGTVSIVPLGQDETAIAALDRIKLVNPPPEQLQKGEDGLFRLAEGGVAAADAGVRVVSGAREGSNVNAVDALVNMIDHSRSYETYVKLMQSARENDETAQRLLRGGG